jgi:hypothetical protein
MATRQELLERLVNLQVLIERYENWLAIELRLNGRRIDILMLKTRLDGLVMMRREILDELLNTS